MYTRSSGSLVICRSPAKVGSAFIQQYLSVGLERWSLSLPNSSFTLCESLPLMQGFRRKNHCRSEEHTSELQSPCNLVCRLLLEKKITSFTLGENFASIMFIYLYVLLQFICHSKDTDNFTTGQTYVKNKTGLLIVSKFINRKLLVCNDFS